MRSVVPDLVNYQVIAAIVAAIGGIIVAIITKSVGRLRRENEEQHDANGLLLNHAIKTLDHIDQKVDTHAERLAALAQKVEDHVNWEESQKYQTKRRWW